MGFSAHTIHARPNSTRPEDVYAADAFNQFQAGATLQPVVTGDYPQVSTVSALMSPWSP